jgi:hypothetical protein
MQFQIGVLFVGLFYNVVGSPLMSPNTIGVDVSPKAGSYDTYCTGSHQGRMPNLVTPDVSSQLTIQMGQLLGRGIDICFYDKNDVLIKNKEFRISANQNTAPITLTPPSTRLQFKATIPITAGGLSAQPNSYCLGAPLSQKMMIIAKTDQEIRELGWLQSNPVVKSTIDAEFVMLECKPLTCHTMLPQTTIEEYIFENGGMDADMKSPECAGICWVTGCDNNHYAGLKERCLQWRGHDNIAAVKNAIMILVASTAELTIKFGRSFLLTHMDLIYAENALKADVDLYEKTVFVACAGTSILFEHFTPNERKANGKTWDGKEYFSWFGSTVVNLRTTQKHKVWQLKKLFNSDGTYRGVRKVQVSVYVHVVAFVTGTTYRIHHLAATSQWANTRFKMPKH